MKHLEAWFITGSQHLYGEETLKQVADHSQQIASALHHDPSIPVKIIFKPVVKTPEEIFAICQQANSAADCIGIIAWMHTFSPAKMWIGGLKILHKPLLHLHTQFNALIPWSDIDMNFMNLNQSAHGDREFGFIMSRMRLNRKVVVGHWQEADTIKDIEVWTRAAAAWHDWQGAKFARFGDNMRQVAVTEGDKVEAQIQFGYSVNGYGMGDLVKVVNEVSDSAIDQLVKLYADEYALAPALAKGGSHHASLREAAKIEIGLTYFLTDGNFKGFTDTFEDLHGLVQLPGLAVQRLMNKGFGFGGRRRLEDGCPRARHEGDGHGPPRRQLIHGRLHVSLRGRQPPGAGRSHARDMRVDRRRKTRVRNSSVGNRREGRPRAPRLQRSQWRCPQRFHHRHGQSLPPLSERSESREARASIAEAPRSPRAVETIARYEDSLCCLDLRGRCAPHLLQPKPLLPTSPRLCRHRQHRVHPHQCRHQTPRFQERTAVEG